MTNIDNQVCNYTQHRHEQIAAWRRYWTALNFAVGASLIFLFFLAVFFFIQEFWLPGAISTIGFIFEGAALKWFTNQRRESVAEEEAAYLDVERVCHPRWIH